MTKKEKKKKSLEDELDIAVDAMIDGIMSKLEEGYDNAMVPFDTYVKKERMRTKKDLKTFRMRMRKGYIAILNALKERPDIKKEDKELLLRHIAAKHINTLDGDFRIYP